MSDKNNLHLSEEETKILLDIFRQNLPVDAEVWVFGSRAKATCKPFSDLDLLIDFAGRPIPLDISGALREALNQSSLPFTVDFADKQLISPNFFSQIEADLIRVWPH